jgi:hypothetical protein
MPIQISIHFKEIPYMRSPATRFGRRPLSVRAITLGLAALALGTTLLAPAAGAQNYARTTTLSVFGGYNVASDLFESDYNSPSSATLELKNAFMWGGRLTKFTNEYSAVEFAYTRNTTDLEVHNFGGAAIPGDFKAGRIDSDQYDLNFLASQPSINPNMWPYFTLGFGWTVTHPQVNAVDPAAAPIKVDGNNLFAFNFGLGTLVNMNDKMSLRLDARWRVTDTHITTSSGYYCDYWGYCWSYASDWYNSGEFTGGITYRLGR